MFVVIFLSVMPWVTSTEEIINPFSTNVPLLHPLKTSVTLRFSDVFRGYRSRILVKNGLMENYTSCAVKYTNFFWRQTYSLRGLCFFYFDFISFFANLKNKMIVIHFFKLPLLNRLNLWNLTSMVDTIPEKLMKKGGSFSPNKNKNGENV